MKKDTNSDTWVVFDVTQFTPKSWMTRNRILHPQSGWQYVGVECAKASQSKKIHEIRLLNPSASRDKLLGQLAHYKRHAPYWAEVRDMVRDTFDGFSGDSLVQLNTRGLSTVCAYLNIPFSPLVCSTADLHLPPIEHPGQWALEICSALGAAHYINPPGGKELFRPEEFAARNIRLSFTQLRVLTYDCPPYTFEAHLSILDALMWIPPEDLRKHLKEAVLENVV